MSTRPRDAAGVPQMRGFAPVTALPPWRGLARLLQRYNCTEKPMTVWEFKIVPAPRKGTKAKGAKTTEDRFAVALEELMNSYGAQGWDYVRAEALPVEERKGLTGKTITTQNMLVFRRPKPGHHVAATGATPVAPSVIAPAPSLGPAAAVPGNAPSLDKPE